VLTPFIPIKFFDKIKENILNIVPAIPEQFNHTQLPHADGRESTNNNYPVIKSISNTFHDRQKNEDMLLNDFFGALNY
jgi:hypothetical protein